MRTQLCMAMAIALSLATSSVQAQTFSPDYPVCMHAFDRGGGSYFDCTFTSVSQCRASASGRAAMCDVNPYYEGGRQVGARRHHRHQLQ